MLVFDNRPSSVWLRPRRLRSVAMAFPSARSAFTALEASELVAFEVGDGAAPGAFLISYDRMNLSDYCRFRQTFPSNFTRSSEIYLV